MKSLRLFILIIILSALFLGCSPEVDEPIITPTPEQSVIGGVIKPAENINVKDIDIAQDGELTVITISMLSGSRAAGYTESKLVKLPKYEITPLQQLPPFFKNL